MHKRDQELDILSPYKIEKKNKLLYMQWFHKKAKETNFVIK